MLFRMKACLPVTLCLLLAGCDWLASVRGENDWITVPALPVIEEAVLAMAPQGVERTPRYIAPICALARGELDVQNVDRVLSGLAQEQQLLVKRWVDGGAREHARVCASYLATSVLLPVDMAEFTQAVDKPAGKGEKAPTTEFEINNAQLLQTMAAKSAGARVNADIFAIIANRLEHEPGLDLDAYRKRAQALFIELSPVYLQRLRVLALPQSTEYQLIEAKKERFAFSTSTGLMFEHTPQGLRLWQSHIPWYGAGELFGKVYQLQVKALPDNLQALIER